MPTILHTESSHGWGGQEIRILEESLGMKKRGYRIIIAASAKSKIFEKALEAGIEVFPAEFVKKNPFSLIKAALLMTREQVDILNTHSSSDSWVASFAAKISASGPKILRTRHLSTAISRSWLSRFIYAVMPDAIVTTGEEIRRAMIGDNGFDASNIFSIPTGVDLKRFDPERVRPALLPEGFSVAMIGVLRSWKGHQFLIRAIPEITENIPEAHFLIVGEGPQYRNIRNAVTGPLEKKVTLLGHREDIPAILAGVNVVVHPSYANEGVPQSILQALAMKRPVVASDAGAIKEVIADRETGFLVEPKNPGAIAKSVIALYKNPRLRTEFGEKGRRLVEEHYSFEKMLDKMESVYERILRNGKRSGARKTSDTDNMEAPALPKLKK